MSQAKQKVELYFDPISPYAYLALEQLTRKADEIRVDWQVRPVVYAKLLEAHGLVGPVETKAKRDYTMLDVVRCAERIGITIEGPPAHPFRSLSALRVLMLFADSGHSLDLALRISRAAWAEGLDLEDWNVLAALVRDSGLDPDALEQRASAPNNKQSLIQATSTAVEYGIFGVPSFRFRQELFWGHDRLEALFERLTESAPAPSSALVEKLIARPIAVRRQRPN